MNTSTDSERAPAFTIRIPQNVRVPAKNRAAEKRVSLSRIVIDFLEDFGAGRAEQYPKPKKRQSSS